MNDKLFLVVDNMDPAVKAEIGYAIAGGKIIPINLSQASEVAQGGHCGNRNCFESKSCPNAYSCPAVQAFMLAAGIAAGKAVTVHCIDNAHLGGPKDRAGWLGVTAESIPPIPYVPF